MQAIVTPKRTPRMLFPAVIVLITVILDQVSKMIARQQLAQKPAIELLSGSFWLMYTQNPGAFLGLGSALSETIRFFAFVVFVIVVLAALLYFIFRYQQVDHLLMVALSLVAGGGIGNLIDRLLFHGDVADFMYIRVWIVQTGVFNLADLAIMVGIVLILISSLKSNKT